MLRAALVRPLPKLHPNAVQYMRISSSAAQRASAPSNEPQTNPDVLYTGVSWISLARNLYAAISFRIVFFSFVLVGLSAHSVSCTIVYAPI